MSAGEVQPGYKLTEVGVIPDDWEVTKIDKIAEKVGSGITPTGGSRVYQLCGRPFIRSQNVGWGELLLDDIAFIDEATHASFNSTEIKSGDVLLNITGASIGRSAVADQRIQGGNVNQHVCIIRTHQEKIAPHFLNAVLLSEFGQRQIEGFQAGGNRQGLNFGQIRSFQVPLPPLPEQRAIAEALGDVDALLAALERLIAKQRAVKQAAMDALLSGWVRLPGFEGEWKRVSIDKDAVLKARIGWQGLTTEEYLTDGDYFLVTGTDFGGDGRINWKTCFFVDQWRYSQDLNIQLRPGDVLLTKDGTIGKVAYVDILPGPATLNSGVFVIRPRNDAFAPLYLFYVLTSEIFMTFLGLLQAGSTIAHLYQKDFVKFSFLAPPLPEQRAIAEVLSDMDAAIAALERQRAKVQAIKQGMMQELLTGRVRLV